nr:MAG TPA: hypothetical protein [Caudoviricetes sp.]
MSGTQSPPTTSMAGGDVQSAAARVSCLSSPPTSGIDATLIHAL